MVTLIAVQRVIGVTTILIEPAAASLHASLALSGWPFRRPSLAAFERCARVISVRCEQSEQIVGRISVIDARSTSLRLNVGTIRLSERRLGHGRRLVERSCVGAGEELKNQINRQRPAETDNQQPVLAKGNRHIWEYFFDTVE